MTTTKIKILCLIFLLAGAAFGQNGATSLQSLIAEARQNNAAIKASNMSVATARYGPKQASALPDAELMLQQFSVAGFGLFILIDKLT